MVFLQVLVALLCPSNIRQYRQISPLLLTLLLTIADASLTLEETAAYLKRTPKAFENVVAKREIPKDYLTERRILFSRKALNEWLMGRYPRDVWQTLFEIGKVARCFLSLLER